MGRLPVLGKNVRLWNMHKITRILVVGLLFSACSETNKEAVVARVGKATITETEFQHRVTEVAPNYQNYVLTPHGRKQFLEVLIREKMILQASRSDGILNSPVFKDRMRALREDEEKKLAEARDYLMTRLWLDKLREDGVLKVDDAAVQDYYRKNPVEVQARHILLPTAEEAEAIVKRIRRGASFAKIAEKDSLDADSAAEGGRMRPALRGEIIPELEVLFKMSTGEIGGPVRSKFGYHVLLKESAVRPSLEKVKDRIRDIVEKQKLDDHLKSLQRSFPVEVVDAQFK